MFLVLGLGNPGTRYAGTRHNVGFLVVDVLARRAGISVDKEQAGALVAKAIVGGQPGVLAKPQQFMNLSGGPASTLATFYKVDLEHTIVLHDDMDVPFGEVRVKVGGGHGGHNGLRDLHARLGGDGYLRVRVGVSRPPPGWDPANYVLGRFSDEETQRLEDVANLAADAVESIVRGGVIDAMNQFNGRRTDGVPTRAAAPKPEGPRRAAAS